MCPTLGSLMIKLRAPGACPLQRQSPVEGWYLRFRGRGHGPGAHPGQGSAAPSTRRCPAHLFPCGLLMVPKILEEKLLVSWPVGAEPSSVASSKGAGNLHSCLPSRQRGHFRFCGLTRFSPTRQSLCPQGSRTTQAGEGLALGMDIL